MKERIKKLFWCCLKESDETNVDSKNVFDEVDTEPRKITALYDEGCELDKSVSSLDSGSTEDSSGEYIFETKSLMIERRHSETNLIGRRAKSLHNALNFISRKLLLSSAFGIFDKTSIHSVHSIKKEEVFVQYNDEELDFGTEFIEASKQSARILELMEMRSQKLREEVILADVKFEEEYADSNLMFEEIKKAAMRPFRERIPRGSSKNITIYSEDGSNQCLAR